jgi:hypothetical protein
MDTFTPIEMEMEIDFGPSGTTNRFEGPQYSRKRENAEARQARASRFQGLVTLLRQ